MTDEKDSKSFFRKPDEGASKGAVKKASTKKKAAPKKAPKPAGPATYIVNEGKALTVPGRIAGPGDTITAAEVADIEALIKGGYVVKA